MSPSFSRGAVRWGRGDLQVAGGQHVLPHRGLWGCDMHDLWLFWSATPCHCSLLMHHPAPGSAPPMKVGVAGWDEPLSCIRAFWGPLGGAVGAAKPVPVWPLAPPCRVPAPRGNWLRGLKLRG